MEKEKVVKSGLKIGAALAMIISFNVNNSIIWALIHGFLGWLYIFYYATTR